ncbi:MAG: sensor histidine kinase, partial [Pseudogulbenkiania sp.]|nr:sensor histidine kinase [Pseudogulbenkiania sp.]
NLVDNAVRYTPAGGMVTVAVRQTPQQVELSVCDSGPGIPAAERQRVFERFYRGESAGGDGCGLGLAIVEEIARTHRADIALEDVAGGGLRVRVGFPGDA